MKTILLIFLSYRSQAQIKDSSKYYFHKYLYFMEKMNSTRGKQSARYEDSATRYYKLLYRKP